MSTKHTTQENTQTKTYIGQYIDHSPNDIGRGFNEQNAKPLKGGIN